MTAVRPVAFLDRDGVINVDNGYLWKAEECEWIPGAPKAIQALNQAGFFVAVVTNQSGIGRGLYSEEQFLEFSTWFVNALADQGATIDRLLYCPHHPAEALGEYRIFCSCRKPAPGMLETVFTEENVRRQGSFLIGDKESDIAAAHAAGINGYPFQGGRLDFFVESILNGLPDRSESEQEVLNNRNVSAD
jgi:D-glycero-D-manno-heptose 1,7-bisphosphate phosphatase